MDRLRALYRALSDQFKAGLVTATFTFFTTFAVSLIGWLQSAVESVSTDGSFPEVSILGNALVSALLAALTGFGNFLYRELQARGVLPGSGPKYEVSSG